MDEEEAVEAVSELRETYEEIIGEISDDLECAEIAEKRSDVIANLRTAQARATKLAKEIETLAAKLA